MSVYSPQESDEEAEAKHYVSYWEERIADEATDAIAAIEGSSEHGATVP